MLPPSGPITAWDCGAAAPGEDCPCGDSPADAGAPGLVPLEDALVELDELLDCDRDEEDDDDDVRDVLDPDEVVLRGVLDDGGAVGGGV